jgi:sulfite reductase (NADPH) flavoprotein alpha-component
MRKLAPLTVLNATDSGNAEGLAIKVKKAAQKHGLDARAIDMADADMGLLTKTKNFIVYAATWVEGESPSRAAEVFMR